VSRYSDRYDRAAHVDRVLNLGLVGFVQRTALEILGRVAWHFKSHSYVSKRR
jgi:hypothetical protein